MTAWYATLWDHDYAAVQWTGVALACLIAAVSDVRSRRIPNALTFTCLLGGLMFAAALGGWAGLCDGLAGMAIALVPFFILFVFAGGGAGDAKMMAAVGAWTGVIGGLLAVGGVLIAGGVLALVYTVATGRLRHTTNNVLWMLVAMRTAVLARGAGAPAIPRVTQLQAMPYGPAIFLGVCAAGGFTLTWHGMI